jgi:hypothetical protein
MDIFFGLLEHIDECLDDVIFFADEGGSWQVGIDWEKVLPVWFKVLSASAEPQEYATWIATVLSTHYSYGRDKPLCQSLILGAVAALHDAERVRIENDHGRFE